MIESTAQEVQTNADFNDTRNVQCAKGKEKNGKRKTTKSGDTKEIDKHINITRRSTVHSTTNRLANNANRLTWALSTHTELWPSCAYCIVSETVILERHSLAPHRTSNRWIISYFMSHYRVRQRNAGDNCEWPVILCYIIHSILCFRYSDGGIVHSKSVVCGCISFWPIPDTFFRDILPFFQSSKVPKCHVYIYILSK